jgi:hypothetical protein
VVQVHRQEGNICGDIGIPEPVDELDAVVDTDAFIETDMGGMEVAVAVPYPALGYAFPEQWRVRFDEAPGVGFNTLES